MQIAQLSQFSEFLERPLPDSIMAIPSMMSINERRLLYGLAKDWFTGKGVIVDAGVFLGSSTRCFGEGILKNMHLGSRPNEQKLIRTFEFAVMNPGMPAFFERHKVPEKVEVGGSFEHVLRRNIEPVQSMVDLAIGDICHQSWNGDEIEICFLDVIKSKRIHSHVIDMFYPSLLVGSILIQQDYFINSLTFLKITQEYLSDYFEYLGEIQSSAVFKLVKKLPHFDGDPAEALPLESQLKLLDQARDRSVDVDRRFMVELSKAHVMVDAGEYDAAGAFLESLEQSYREQTTSALPRLRQTLRTARNAVRLRRSAAA